MCTINARVTAKRLFYAFIAKDVFIYIINGGLREKSIAAHRSGLKTIIIPKDNIKDLEDIPDSVRNSLNIIPVESVDEVVKFAIKK